MGKDEDTNIWDFAASNGYAIVRKDKDFYQRSLAIGYLPKGRNGFQEEKCCNEIPDPNDSPVTIEPAV